MADTFDVLATQFESLRPRKQWHEVHLNDNRQNYDGVCQFLANIDGKMFPTVNTWYAANWQRLTAPFSQERFPTLTERDELVELIVAIQNSETRRASMLAERSQIDSSIGYCLSDSWKNAVEMLRSFEY
jgi:hypothetical protein